MSLYVSRLETNAKRTAAITLGQRTLLVGGNRSQKSGIVAALKHALELKEPGIDMTGQGLRRLAHTGAEDYTSTAHLSDPEGTTERVLSASVVVGGTTAKAAAPKYILSTALSEALMGGLLAEDVSATVREALRGTAASVRSEIVSVIAPAGVIEQVRRALPDTSVEAFNAYVTRAGDGAEVDVLAAVAAAVASDMRALAKTAKREAGQRPVAPTAAEVQALETAYNEAIAAEAACREHTALLDALPRLHERAAQLGAQLQAARETAAARPVAQELPFTAEQVKDNRQAYEAAAFLLRRIEARFAAAEAQADTARQQALRDTEHLHTEKCAVCRRPGERIVYHAAREQLATVVANIDACEQALRSATAATGPDIVGPAERLYYEAVAALQRAQARAEAPPSPPAESAATINERLQVMRAAVQAQLAHDAEEAEAIQARGKRAHLEVIKQAVAAVEKAQVERCIADFEAQLAGLLPATFDDRFVAQVFDGGKAVMNLGLESKTPPAAGGKGFRAFPYLSGFERGLVTAALCPAWAGKKNAAVRLFVQDEVGVEPHSLRVLAHTVTAAMLLPNSITQAVITTLPQLITSEIVEELQGEGWTVLFLDSP